MALGFTGYTNFLLKKTLGVTNTIFSSTDITTETAGVTFPKMLASSQLFPYPIPPVAPTAPDTPFTTSYSNTVIINGTSTITAINATTLNAKTSANPDLVFTGYIDANGGITQTSTAAYGLMYTSKTYPWIQYVDRLQMRVVQRIGYSYGPNRLLATAIPGNYDVIESSYAITVNPSVGSFNSSSVVPGSQYIIEKDAGYIYFTGLNWIASATSLSNSSAIPLVSFYRYSGTIGIPTNLGNFAGAYLQGTGAIAYGDSAGYTGQGVNAIAMGNLAGAYGQGTGSIAIGNLAGPTGMSANSIVLNASGTALAGTGPTGGFYVAPIASYSGSVGPFTLLAYGADKQIVGITGAGMASMGILTVGGITGATGSFTALGATRIVTTSITGATGSFTALGATSIATSSITGATGSFTALGATTITTTNIAGATGYFTSLGAQEIIGSTGIFNFLIVKDVEYVKVSYTSQEYSVTGMTGAIGYFTDFGSNTITTSSITGATGSFTALGAATIAATSIKGATGSFTALGATTIATSSITGATGSFTALEAGTGYIGNVVTSKIGTHAGMINQGANALAIGTFAGAYGQGAGSIAIGAFAGPTGMSANSIVLNASGTALSGTGPTGGFYVAPIASYKNASNPTGPFQLLAYGPDNQIVTVTGATGLNLSLSTPTVTYDSWLLANMIGAPPAVESLAVDSFTTTDVYITFSYPSQMYSGLSQSGLLPYINNMFVNIGMDGVSGIDINGVTGINYIDTNYSYIAPFPGFKNSFSKNFIAQTTPVEPAHVVQCINVTKSASKSSGLGTYTTTKTTPGKTLKSYTIPYTSLTSTQLATFYIWYANNNPNKNVAFIPFQYKGAQNPTQVGSLTVIPSATSQSITITFTGSSAIDSGDALSTASINYAISYRSIDGSNKHRYGGTKSSGDGDVNGQTIGPTGTAGGNQSQIITSSIYPDTEYYFTVNASNTTLGTGSFTGTTGTSIKATTGPAPPVSQTSRSEPLSLNILSAKPVFGGSTVSNLLKTTTNTLPSLTRPFNIHNSYESRGYTGPDPLVNFTTNLWGFTGPNGVTGFTGPSVPIYGFSGSYSYPISSQNGIDLSFSTPVDTGSETDGTNGYYLKTDTTVSISNASNIVASSNQYTLCVTGTYSSGNGASASAATTFYYDGETGTNGIPSISSQPAISIASASTGAVCGINVVTSISFNVGVIGVTGIGQYFYNKDGIISYTPTGSAPLPQNLSFTPSREMDLSKLTSGTGANGFNTPISFSNTISLSGIASSQYYAGPVGVSVTPYNLGNTGGNAVSSNTVQLIFDPVSVANKSAFRVCSVNAGNEAVSYDSSSNSGSRNDVAANVTSFPTYDNTVSLNQTDLSSSYKKEALYTNGAYVASGSGFINYGEFSNNSFNYSGINGGITYRYVTYKWSISSTIPQFNTISFTLTNLTNYNRSNNSIYYGTNQTERLRFFYRFEDSTNDTTKINWGSGGQISTPWIDGNYVASSSNAPSGASAPTSSNADNVYFTPCGGTSASTGNILVVKLPYSINSTIQTTSSNMSLYCRVGLSTSVSFTTSFKDITYTLSTS